MSLILKLVREMVAERQGVYRSSETVSFRIFGMFGIRGKSVDDFFGVVLSSLKDVYMVAEEERRK